MKIPVNISSLTCNECSISTRPKTSGGNANILYDVSMSTIENNTFIVNLDVKKIKWERIGENIYSASAEMLVSCPVCDKQHELLYKINAPKMFLEQNTKCKKCNNLMTFCNEKITVEDIDGQEYLKVSGFLFCKHCNSKEDINLAKTVSMFEGEKMNKDEQYKITINNSQIILAKDKAKVDATINRTYDTKEFKKLLSKAKDETKKINNQNTKDSINKTLDSIEVELNKENPKKEIIKSILTGLSVIKGTFEFGAALTALIQFIQDIL